jgi:hypothetical protein
MPTRPTFSKLSQSRSAARYCSCMTSETADKELPFRIDANQQRQRAALVLVEVVRRQLLRWRERCQKHRGPLPVPPRTQAALQIAKVLPALNSR